MPVAAETAATLIGAAPAVSARGAHSGDAFVWKGVLSCEMHDLSGEGLLQNAPKIRFQGREVFALGGIPLLAKLGQGGMGAVYLGVHPRLKSEVAVKVLPMHLAEKMPEMVDRFFREGQIAAKVKSPNLVGVLDVNQEGKLFYLVMEYVYGAAANSLIGEAVEKQKPISEATALDICLAATQGLQAAHSAGVIHRDLKPANILIPRDARTHALHLESAKLADLGIARAEDDNTQLTGTMATIGTPGYMSPEQAQSAKKANKASDVFSMGATLYAFLSGKPPFQGESSISVIMATVQQPHMSIRALRGEISRPTETLLDICLAKDPHDRFRGADSLLQALKVCRGALDQPVSRQDEAIKLLKEIQQSEELVQIDLPSVAQPAVRNTGRAWAYVAGAAILALVAFIVFGSRSGDSGARSGAGGDPAAPLTALDLGNGVRLELAEIAAGRFEMGSLKTEPDRASDEGQDGPHVVALTQPFLMGKTPVSQAQYEQVMGANPSKFKGPQRPVENVSFADAEAFCKKASEKTGHTVLLPTEAQWEYACRAGSAMPFSTGAQITAQAANFQAEFGYAGGKPGVFRGQTTDVGSFEPNAKNLYDMHGNVWQWCRDVYSPDYYAASPMNDPCNQDGAPVRVARGGAWNYPPMFARAAARFWLPPAYKGPDCGFRVIVLSGDRTASHSNTDGEPAAHAQKVN